MDYLQEHLDQIYLQEDLKSAAKNFIAKFKNFKGNRKNIKQIKPMLKDVPEQSPDQIASQAKKLKGFDKNYKIAQRKLKGSADTPAGKGISTLYGLVKSLESYENDKKVDNVALSKGMAIIENIFALVFKHPEKIRTTGFDLWILGWLGIFFFSGMGSITVAFTAFVSVGWYIWVTGMILSVLKFFLWNNFIED